MSLNSGIAIPLITACILLGTELIRIIRRTEATADVQALNIVLVDTLKAIDKNVNSLCTATDRVLETMPERLKSLEASVKELRNKLDRPANAENVT